MNAKKCYEIFARLQKANPNPKCELNYHSHFELLVAVILSAHSTDVSVNKATEKLFAVAHTPEQIYALGEHGLKKYIKTIGLYNNKAKNIIKTCKILIDKYKSAVPNKREDLEALPGIGRKSANVILNNAFNEPTIAVDTHVFRVCNRTELAPGKTPLDVEKKLEQVTPKPFKLNASHWLILHGRYTCLARKPLCSSCIIADLCEYKDKNWLAG